MNLILRTSSPDDLDFVLEAEQSAENRRCVEPWDRHEHLAAMESEDTAHLIIERPMTPHRVGHIILTGLSSKHASIELKRIVVVDKGKGYGSHALALVKGLAFEEWNTHRLWLDVKVVNARARRLYEAAGFVEEGILRECLKRDEGFESLIVMAMLRREYVRRASADPVSKAEQSGQCPNT